jgi:hypothetical protein
MQWLDRMGAVYSRNPELPVLREAGQDRPDLVILAGDDDVVAMLERLDERWVDTIKRALFSKTRVVILGAGPHMTSVVGGLAGASAGLRPGSEAPSVHRWSDLAAGLDGRSMRALAGRHPRIFFGHGADARDVVRPGLLVRFPHGGSDVVVSQLAPGDEDDPAADAQMLQLLTNVGLTFRCPRGTGSTRTER